MQIRRALISVSDKTGIVDFAKTLAGLGVQIISTGGTADLLTQSGVAVTPVSEVTGFPEMMDGRVKTLHPKIHGGLLALRDNSQHMKDAEKSTIEMIDMVVVNLYPFRETISKPDVRLEEAIENIDIGGPTMVRSAAKNYQHVVVVTDPADYGEVADHLRRSGALPTEMRARLCVKAFRLTADYDGAVDRYLSEHLADERILRLKYVGGEPLRYGENWHQSAVFYRQEDVRESCTARAVQLHGREMSYNNYIDVDAAIEAVKDIRDQIGACVIKHTNPCGYATGPDLAAALEQAWNGDRERAMGSIIAVTRRVDRGAAEFLRTSYVSPLVGEERPRFIEIIVAPGYDPDGLELLKRKSKDLRLLEVPELDVGPTERSVYRPVMGGMLEQTRDEALWEKWEVVTKASFPKEKRGLAQFSYIAAKHTKSNAIVLARAYQEGCYQVIGMGAGQPNRIDSLRKLSFAKARENLECEFAVLSGSGTLEEYMGRELSEVVLASDAFFPFDDTVKVAHELGIRYIVQPGGSMQDENVIATADRLGISMVFTGTRHFRH